jgi:hypothetical protein
LENFRAICCSELFGHKVRLDSKELKTGLAMKETKGKAWKDWTRRPEKTYDKLLRFTRLYNTTKIQLRRLRLPCNFTWEKSTHMLNDGTNSALGKSTGELSNLFSRYLPGCCINIGR